MAALSTKVGKQSAHLLVYEASMAGIEAGLSFRDALDAVPAITKVLSPAEIDDLLDLDAAIGEAPEVVDEILASLGDRERGGGQPA
jgi:adenylosuccinate lyase